MTVWLLARTVLRAPRRLALAALGIVFPVAILAATLFFVDLAVRTMTRVALQPVQVEMRALATSLDTKMTNVGRQLATVPGVRRVERFAAADVVVATPKGRATARLFAVDPEYFRHHGWVRATGGSLSNGSALIGPQVRAVPGFSNAKSVSIEIPGHSGSVLKLPVTGTADLRDAFTWFQIPYGDVQGDIAQVPRAVVVPYARFERSVLPRLRAALGPQTAVLNPGNADLPPATLEAHLTIDHSTYPGDPGRAKKFSDSLKRVLERRAPGSIIVADDAAEPLMLASQDATNAKILFLLLGIPGVLVAAALGLATESALAEAQRREEALLRLRGATEGELARFAAAQAALAGVIGAVAGLVIAAAAVGAVEGRAVWHGVPAGRLALSALLAVAAGAIVTGVRLVRLRRAARREEVSSERRLLQRGWSPAWRRSHLDVVAIGIGGAILLVNALAGGLQPSQTEGSTVIASFYLLLAPIALWVGFALLATRLFLGGLARRARPDRSAPLASWMGAVTRWLGRRPARMGVALALGTLAIAFGTEVVAFVATYHSARNADARAAFGSNLHLRPATEGGFVLPSRLPGVAATTPIVHIPVRAGTDRKTVMAVQLSSYRRATTEAPQITSGHGLDALERDPRGIIVSKEIAGLFSVKPGDTLPLTVFPDDSEKSRKVDFHVRGVYRSFPPTSPISEIVFSTRALPPYLIPPPDFYEARVDPGMKPVAVAADLRARGLERAFKVTTLADQKSFDQPSVTALNLGPLSDIESVGAALIAALGVAVLGAFIVLERRREFAILRVIGADTAHLLAGPAQEGVIATVGSLVVGIPLGLGLSIIAVRLLGLFFTLPPPLLSVPVGTLAVFALVMLAASAAAVGAALFAVNRAAAAGVLREP